jgi:hypothetical protein
MVSSCSAEKRTVSFSFFIAGSPHRDDSNGLAAPRPNHSDEAPIELTDAQPAFFREAGRGGRVERPAVEQDLGIDEIEPAGFQHGSALCFGPLKIHPSQL